MRQSLVRWGTMAALLAAPTLAPSHACAATRHVPADYATIQAAIDASVAGDSVLVAPGTYTGQPHTGPVCANVVTEHVVAELKPGIVLKSTGGQQVTILDGGPMAPFGPRTVRLVSQDGPPTKVEGFSITSGLVGVAVGCTSSEVTISDCRIWGTDAFGVVVSEATVNLLDCQVEGNTGEAVRVSFGGGVLRVERTRFEGNLDEALVSLRGGSLTVIDCEFVNHSMAGVAYVENTDSFLFRNCLFYNNSSARRGTALAIAGSSGVVERCTFAYNTTTAVGGAMYILEDPSNVTIRNNTFYRCEAPVAGGAITWLVNSGAVHNNIVAECSAGALTADGSMTDSGCNLFWNNESNYITWPENAQATDIEADPRFCDPESLDFTVHSQSPAVVPLVGNCGPQIGAFGVGCGAVSVEASSWGKIKNHYREVSR